MKLEDGSEVSIQQYIEEQGSQVLGDLQGSYLQKNLLQESYMQGQQLEGYLQGQGAYGQERSYLQGQGGIGQGLHMAGDEGDSFTLDLGMEEELASMQVPIIPLDITIILIIQITLIVLTRPLLQGVQGPRLVMEADSGNSGGVRFVVVQEGA